MPWTPLITEDGSRTLVHPVHGEACHSRAGAWQESRERYAKACRLAEFRGEVFRLLDIGTGLGLNLAAALEALDSIESEPRPRLWAVSLERDPSVLRATLDLARSSPSPAEPPEVDRWHAPVRAAIERALRGEAEVRIGALTLELILGDARETLPRLPREVPFDAVFLDTFSPRLEPELWQPDFLREVARRMGTESLLSTYSASTHVRASLLASGLRIGPGARVGTKSSGTIASPGGDLGAFEARAIRRIVRRASALTLGPERLGMDPQTGLTSDSSSRARLRADP